MKKVSVIGAGNVGATVAHVIAQRDFVKEVVILDIKKGISEGKALDMWETSSINHFDTHVIGATNDYAKTKDSDVVVITAGIPRKPGMSRDDLIKINAGIVAGATKEAIKHSPNAIFIIVSNPLDVMTYVAYKTAGIPANKVMGMAGVLDTARYKSFLALELDTSPNDIQALLLGGHGDSMVPLTRYTSVSGIPVEELIEKKRLNEIIERTKKGGGELVNLMGTSAWYAPGASVADMVETIIKDQNRILPVCAYLNGEYGYKDLYIGVPVRLNENGIGKILELDLNKEEKEMFNQSASAVKKVMDTLSSLNIF